ncbi:MAG: ABC transporter substrate-binding protein [Deltaproteobacteria bacterium]|nr:ABC transporter substrate-binding protein [Deltaproteobacteria bacterium]
MGETSEKTSNTGLHAQQANSRERGVLPRTTRLTGRLGVVFVSMMLVVLPACKRNRKVVNAEKPVRKEGASATDPLRALEELEMRAHTLPRPDAVKRDASQPGGNLTVHLEAEPPHLHPLLENNESTWRITDRLVFEPLFDCSAGALGEPVPLLASAPGRFEQGVEPLYFIELRRGVRFHDGRPFTALDVQATLEPLIRANSHRPLFKALLADVASIEIRGEFRVVLRLSRPSHLVARALCEVPILPEPIARQSQPARGPVAGTGPMKVGAWERGRRIRLVRNETYHGTPMALDGIDFEVETDGARAMTKVKRGQIDLLPRVLEQHIPDQMVGVSGSNALDLVRVEPFTFSFLAVNVAADPLSDVHFRQALSLLWDRKRMSRELRKGLFTPIDGPTRVAPTTASLNREAAAQLLDNAGYVDGNDDGVRDRNGQPIRLRLIHMAGSKASARELHLFSLELRRAGLLLDLVPLDAATFASRLSTRNFDLAPLVWEGRPLEDPRLLFGANSPFNYGGYRSVHLDAMVDELMRAQDLAAQKLQLERIAAFLAIELPAVFLYRQDTLALVGRRVHGLSADGGFLDLRRVWLQSP